MGRGFALLVIAVVLSSYCGVGVYAQGHKDVLYSHPEKKLKVIYGEFDDDGAYSVQISPDVDPPSNSNINTFPFDKNKDELVRVAKEAFTVLLMKHYPQICTMLDVGRIRKAVFYLSFFEERELFDKFFTFFAVVDKLKELPYLNAFEKIVVSDNHLRTLVKEAGDLIYSSVLPSIPKKEQPIAVRNKMKRGYKGYDYCNFIFIEIYPNDVRHRIYDSIEFVKTEHEDMNCLSITEKNPPVTNSKLHSEPFNSKDERFRQVCKEAFVRSLEVNYPAVCTLVESGKLSEVRLTVNLDAQGEMVDKGFNFYVTTKFPAITDALTRKFKWSTLLRQIVKDTGKRIYAQYPVDLPKDSLSEDVRQKVEAGEKGYDYYTKTEICITKEDLTSL